jgi:NitT/TauT family transport system ATP-binding protein
MAAGQALIEVRNVRQAFPRPSGAERVVIDKVNMSLREHEIVGLLGRSGCGKSTLLRIVAGLAHASAGEVVYLGKPIEGPAEGIAMVFQTFALFPWLTVLENVEAGLEAQGVAEREMRKRALAAIDLIGLDGFESAYPRELSGGMRQRVGLARALVVNPAVLLMDEPFSALDVLTAETLRTDLIELWNEGKLPIRSILMVTHNIEEAVLMCDRILMLAETPGRVVAEFTVDLPQPRNRLAPRFRALVDDIYARMTERPREPAKALAQISYRMSHVSANTLAGLMETLASDPYRGKADLPHIATSLQLEVDDLWPIVEGCGSGLRRAGRGRHHLDRLGPLVRRFRPRAPQAPLRLSVAPPCAAGGPHPPCPRRAPRPPRASRPLRDRARGPAERGGRPGDPADRHLLGPLRRAFLL